LNDLRISLSSEKHFGKKDSILLGYDAALMDNWIERVWGNVVSSLGVLICPLECGYVQDITTLEGDAPFPGNIGIQLPIDAEPYHRRTESSVTLL
jgi:hypothetical protein